MVALSVLYIGFNKEWKKSHFDVSGFFFHLFLSKVMIELNSST